MKVFSCWSQRSTARAWSSINYGNNGDVAPLPAPGPATPATPAPTFTTFNSHKDGSDQGSDDTSTHGVESAQDAVSSSLPEEKNTPNRWFKSLSCKELKAHWCEDVCIDLVGSITMLCVFVMCVFFFFFFSHSLLALKENWTWSLRSMRFQDGNFPPRCSLPSFPR